MKSVMDDRTTRGESEVVDAGSVPAAWRFLKVSHLRPPFDASIHRPFAADPSASAGISSPDGMVRGTPSSGQASEGLLPLHGVIAVTAVSAATGVIF